MVMQAVEIRKYDSRAVNAFRMCIPLFQALGDPIRQDILLLLAEQKTLNVNQIAQHSPMSRPTVSHHLRILKEAGLVKSERKGTENYYSLKVRGAVHDLKTLITMIEQEYLIHN